MTLYYFVYYLIKKTKSDIIINVSHVSWFYRIMRYPAIPTPSKDQTKSPGDLMRTRLNTYVHP